MQVRRILCPLDFSDASKAAITQAESVCEAFGAELVLAHVVEPVLYPVAYGLAATSAYDLETEARNAAEQVMTPLVEELQARGVKATMHLDTGTPALRLCELCGELEIDMIVMSTHGLTGMKHLLIGSTAERVVRRSPVPVLTVKAPDAG